MRDFVKEETFVLIYLYFIITKITKVVVHAIVIRTESCLETRTYSSRIYCNVVFQEILVPSPLMKP